MNIFTFAGIFALLILIVAGLIAWAMVGLSNVVTANEATIAENEKLKKSVNTKQTKGHEIATSADYATQLEDARKLAARIAAHRPRGANVGIGRAGTTDARKNKKVTSKGLETDPLSAVKIAKYHSWNGLTATKQAAVGGPVPQAAGPVKTVKRKLVPGKDYEFTEYKNLKGAEKRRAIIANCKAKLAAYKALKAAGLDTMTVAAGAAAAGVAPAVAAAPAIELPPAPEMVKITDGMDPAALRKARIANSKAKSAYNKQLKSLGIDPKEVEWTDDGPKLPNNAQAALDAARAAAPAAVAPVAQAVAAASAGVALPPGPDMAIITDDMAPDEKRKARIANSKAKSAYNKELKAAGIDPKTVEWTDAGPKLKAAATPVAPVTAAPVAVAAPAANVPPPPELTVITDDMAPEDKRAARIANSKAKSAYKKELKALGIDPKSVKI